jgi:hypothetical protein
MDLPNLHVARKCGPITTLFYKIAAVDQKTMAGCPEHDHNNACAVAEIQIAVWIYQTALFSIISHRLFATPGTIRPELVFMSMFLATFILLIDSYMVMRSSWHLSGIDLLKRGGIDISGGPWARIKATIFLVVRIGLSVGLAQLTAVFVSILIFASDIDAKIFNAYRLANAHLIIGATEPVDVEIKSATDAAEMQKTHVAALVAQVNTLRNYEIDPTSGDPLVQQAQQELTQMLRAKSKADEDLRATEIFATNELGGIQGSGNSGRPGHGPRHRAAVEQLANARMHAQEATSAVESARKRLDALRKQQHGLALEAIRQQAHDQLPVFEARLAEENAKLSALNDELTRLTHGRNDAIRANIERAPDHVALDNGLLNQIRILDEMAQDSPKIMALILLIDLTSFGFELAAVLAKITSFVPTTYAAILARDAYMGAVRMVDAMVKELNPEPSTDPKEPAIVMPPEPANDNWPAHEQAVRQNPFNGPDDPPPPPPKRPRGRPRKSFVPTEH